MPVELESECAFVHPHTSDVHVRCDYCWLKKEHEALLIAERLQRDTTDFIAKQVGLPTDALDHGELCQRIIRLKAAAASPADLRYWQSRLEATRADAEQRCKARGYEPGQLQWKYRTDPPAVYDMEEALDAILDALTREGVPAWTGDGTSCVEQMIRAQRWPQRC